MRFMFLVVGAAATGALSVGVIERMAPPTAQTFAAVRALGGDLSDFKIGDINPRKAYDKVVREITSGEATSRLALPQAPAVSYGPINIDAWKPTIYIDTQQFQRAFASGIASQIQQNNQRMQDMSAYMRNPLAWHGPPPH